MNVSSLDLFLTLFNMYYMILSIKMQQSCINTHKHANKAMPHYKNSLEFNFADFGLLHCYNALANYLRGI